MKEEAQNNRILAPLPERMRPDKLEDFVGQSQLVGPGSVLRKMIESGNLSSFILWGPPGVGKTTLAHIIASTLNRDFYTLSAVSAGVKDVREVIDSAKHKSLFSSAAAPILFIDEIHRFNKAQQDALLGAVEEGVVVLVGATTENPSFEVITPLLSRCQVFVLKSLDVPDLEELLHRAISNDTILKHKKIEIRQTEALFRQSGGDGRKLLNILELVVDSCTADASHKGKIIIDNQTVASCLQTSTAIYDKGGEMHFDIISAFIKSVRGSDPNAALYWLARMLDGGEDPVFIARRLCLSASEDVGLANPNALLLANATFQVVHTIGMPEARIPLAECTVYLASSPKSNASYLGIEKALQAAAEDKTAAVPLYLRNAPTKLMSDLGYSDGYLYAHDFPGHFVNLEFMPAGKEGTVFYEPADNAQENKLKTYLQACWPKYYTKK